MQLHALLQKIKDKKPVNFDQVVKHMPADINWSDLFSVSALGNNKYDVAIINEALFKIIFEQSMRPETRAQAATSSSFSSHDVKCNSAYMLCFPAFSNSSASVSERSLQVAAVSLNICLALPFTPATHAILIENQDCFFQFSKLLSHYEDQIDVAQSDIYFAGGLRVLNTDLTLILTQYSSIQCLFDYDLAGLRMALLLKKNLRGMSNIMPASSRHLPSRSSNNSIQQNTNDTLPLSIEYLVPSQLPNYASLFTFSPTSAASLANMLSLCQSNELNHLSDMIASTRCFMEQEALLTVNVANKGR